MTSSRHGVQGIVAFSGSVACNSCCRRHGSLQEVRRQQIHMIGQRISSRPACTAGGNEAALAVIVTIC